MHKKLFLVKIILIFLLDFAFIAYCFAFKSQIYKIHN